MRIAIGSDHRGYQAKEKLKAMLVSKGYETLDMGTDSPASFDYPDAAYPTCKAIVNGQADRGILLCGTGIGMCIIANKVQGIRAAPCHDELTAEMSRRRQALGVHALDLERSLESADAATRDRVLPELDKVRGLLAEVSEALDQMQRDWEALPEDARQACVPVLPEAPAR